MGELSAPELEPEETEAPPPEEGSVWSECLFALEVWFWILLLVVSLPACLALCSLLGLEFTRYAGFAFQPSAVVLGVRLWRTRDAVWWREAPLLALQGRWLCGAVCLAINALPVCISLALPSVSGSLP